MSLHHSSLLGDRTNVSILRALRDKPRTSTSELARVVGMSAPATRERVQRLEEAGLIGEDCFIVRAHLARLEDLDALLDTFLVFGQTTTSII